MGTNGPRHPASNGRGLLLAEHQPLLMAGLRVTVDQHDDLRVRAQADTVDQLLRSVRGDATSAVVLGTQCWPTPCIELIHRIRRIDADVPILVLGPYDESVYAIRMLHAGANGYVMTSEPAATVVKAIRTVLAGDVYVSEHVASSLIRQQLRNGGHGGNGQSPVQRLSERELEIFEFIAVGNSVRQIAKALKRSVKTVETHREHIKQKLAIDTSQELAEYAAQWAATQGSDAPPAAGADR